MSTPETSSEDIRVRPSYAAREQTAAEPLNALHTAWQNSALDIVAPERDRKLQRERLQRVIGNAAASTGSPDLRSTLLHFGQVTDYLWFANSNTPRPEALATASTPDEPEPLAILNPYTPLDGHHRRILEYLLPRGLHQLTTYRSRLLERQAPHMLGPMVTAIAANTPAYRLLESFNITRTAWCERPLNAGERLIEEQAVEQRVRRRYGVPPSAPLATFPVAYFEVARAVQHLDQATRFDRTERTQKKTPTERAIEFFWDLARVEHCEDDDSFEQRGNLEELSTYHGPDRDSIRVVTEKQTFLWQPMSFATVAVAEQLLHLPNSQLLRTMSEFVIEDAVIRLFDEQGESLDYQALLDELLALRTEALTKKLVNFATLNSSDRDFTRYATALLNPQDVMFTYDSSILRVPIIPSPVLGSDFVLSRQEYRQAANQRVGIIAKRPPQDTVSRLLQYAHARTDLPALPDRDIDLVLRLDEWNDTLDLTLLGYELVSRDPTERTLGFRYTPEADSYATCNVVLPADKQTSLAQAYADMGLGDLALQVSTASDLTVEQLTQAISQTNRYFLPRKLRKLELPLNLADYASQVSGGRLHMQCQGAAHFLRLSLEHVFGEDSAMATGGLVMQGDHNRISLAGHEQTIFIDPATGSLYVLDATPKTGDRIYIWRDELQHCLDQLKQLFKQSLGTTTVEPQPPQATQTAKQLTPIEELDPIAQAQRKSELFAQVKEEFILQLRMMYGQDGQPMPRDELFNQVIKLPREDLVFRSLSAVATSDIKEAKATLRFLHALQACSDPIILGKVDPHEYTRRPLLLSAINHALSELLRYA